MGVGRLEAGLAAAAILESRPLCGGWEIQMLGAGPLDLRM
jgi:hypothetical protein